MMAGSPCGGEKGVTTTEREVTQREQLHTQGMRVSVFKAHPDATKHPCTMSSNAIPVLRFRQGLECTATGENLLSHLQPEKESGMIG